MRLPHVLPKLRSVLFDVVPLRRVSYCSKIGVCRSRNFRKEKANAYFRVNWVLCGVDNPENCTFCGCDEAHLNKIGDIMKVQGFQFVEVIGFVVDLLKEVS